MSKDEKIFTFRVSSFLLDYLKERADRNKRSIAKELEYIVEDLYFKDHKAVSDSLDKILKLAQEHDYTVKDLAKSIEEAKPDDPLFRATIQAIKALNDAHHILD